MRMNADRLEDQRKRKTQRRGCFGSPDLACTGLMVRFDELQRKFSRTPTPVWGDYYYSCIVLNTQNVLEDLQRRNVARRMREFGAPSR